MPIKRALLASTFAIAAATTTGAQAHAKLESSEPRAGATLDAAPQQIRLMFNEALEPAFSKIKLSDARNVEIPLSPAKVDAADTSTMRVSTPPLRTGVYHVQWSTMTHDGHKAKGEFVFTVK